MVTTIQITPETRDKLKEVGKKGETYEQIIIRLLQEHEQLTGAPNSSPA
ncbi:hypothetical protein M0R72_14915 [Candidatus Pacearchaeota archaeon]|nr:hypothetical protein [Candidatus Pacearchaeota archaeon]